MAWGTVPALSQNIVHNLNQAQVSSVIQDNVKLNVYYPLLHRRQKEQSLLDG